MDNSGSLLAYLEDYGAGEGVQDPSQAAVDSQIRGLSLPLANAIASTDQGTVVDIGCGRGILLHRLNKIPAFKENKGWNYYGTDYEEHKNEIFTFAYESSIHRRVDFVPLDNLYSF